MAERYFKHKIMWNEIAVEELDENTNKSTKFCFNTKELNENTNKSTKFWFNVWQDWALAREYDVDIEKYVEVRIQFCHASNKQVIMRCCSSN
jgi:hypothetical protein